MTVTKVVTTTTVTLSGTDVEGRAVVALEIVGMLIVGAALRVLMLAFVEDGSPVTGPKGEDDGKILLGATLPIAQLEGGNVLVSGIELL